MNVKNWLVILSTVIFAGSCGQNSTKKTETEADTLNNSSTNQGLVDTTNGMNSNVSPTTGSIMVPDQIQSSFRTKYPDVRDVTWTRHEPMSTFDWDWTGWPMLDTSDFLARFNYNGADYWAWYDSDNNWVGSVTTVSDFSTLPAAVNSLITSSYSGYTIDAVDKEFDKNRTAYEIDLSKGSDKMTILVDENGRILKKKTLTDGQRTKEKNQ